MLALLTLPAGAQPLLYAPPETPAQNITMRLKEKDQNQTLFYELIFDGVRAKIKHSSPHFKAHKTLIKSLVSAHPTPENKHIFTQYQEILNDAPPYKQGFLNTSTPLENIFSHYLKATQLIQKSHYTEARKAIQSYRLQCQIQVLKTCVTEGYLQEGQLLGLAEGPQSPSTQAKYQAALLSAQAIGHRTLEIESLIQLLDSHPEKKHQYQQSLKTLLKKKNSPLLNIRIRLALLQEGRLSKKRYAKEVELLKKNLLQELRLKQITQTTYGHFLLALSQNQKYPDLALNHLEEALFIFQEASLPQAQIQAVTQWLRQVSQLTLAKEKPPSPQIKHSFKTYLSQAVSLSHTKNSQRDLLSLKYIQAQWLYLQGEHSQSKELFDTALKQTLSLPKPSRQGGILELTQTLSSLRKLRPYKKFEPLISKAFAHASQTTKPQMIADLKTLDNPELAFVIFPYLIHENKAIRHVALKAITKYKNPALESDFEALLRQRDYIWKADLVAPLRKSVGDTKALSILLPHLKKSNPTLQVKILDLMRWSGHAKHISMVWPLLKNKNEKVRQEAYYALSAIGTQSSIQPLLLKTLKAPSMNEESLRLLDKFHGGNRVFLNAAFDYFSQHKSTYPLQNTLESISAKYLGPRLLMLAQKQDSKRKDCFEIFFKWHQEAPTKDSLDKLIKLAQIQDKELQEDMLWYFKYRSNQMSIKPVLQALSQSPYAEIAKKSKALLKKSP